MVCLFTFFCLHIINYFIHLNMQINYKKPNLHDCLEELGDLGINIQIQEKHHARCEFSPDFC